MSDNERLAKIEQSLSKMSDDITDIKVDVGKLQTKSCEKNSKNSLDMKTLRVVIGLIIAGIGGNWGINKITARDAPEPIVKYITLPSPGYTLEQPHPYNTP